MATSETKNRPRSAPSKDTTSPKDSASLKPSLSSIRKLARHTSMIPNLKLPLFMRSEATIPPLPSSDAKSIRAASISSASSVKVSASKKNKSPHLNPKPGLLTLRLSSTSFLDADVIDVLDVEHPVYHIKTSGTSTAVERPRSAAPAGSSTHRGSGYGLDSQSAYSISTTEDMIKAACIKWPRLIPSGSTHGVLVQMDGGRWKNGESFLRVTNISLSRKFNIPNYSHELKWRAVGSGYHCVAESVKGPIASFQPSQGDEPATFVVYETMHDKNNVRRLLTHGGVSIFLLDYLVVTALLMVTGLQDWMNVPGNVKKGKRFGHDAVSDVAESVSQWKKLMQGQRPSSDELTVDDNGPRLDKDAASISTGSGSGTIAGPSKSNGQPSDLWYSDTDEATEQGTESDTPSQIRFSNFIPAVSTRASSPASESVFSFSGGPGHGYHDPMYYGGEYEQVPPVPPLPAQYAIQNASASSSTISLNSPLSPRRRVKALPQLPPIPQHSSTSRHQPSSPTIDLSDIEPALPLQPRPSLRRRRELPLPPGASPSSSSSRAALHSYSRSLHTTRHPDSPLDINLNLELTPSSPLESVPATQTCFVLDQPLSRPNLIAQTGMSKYAALSLSGRSLPPTPISPYTATNSSWDLSSTAGSSSSNGPSSHDRESGIKDSLGLDISLPSRDRDSVFDVPPPAYHSIDFDGRDQGEKPQ